ncbi:hypothetical protein RhiirA5_382490 [Rhizophagus irregularis]|uniref:Uncharacterized protein n=2 Tax=Rhizophagus irregularis TaxID=588596 RepID=A0A2N0P0P5_9GLOM|nr:hypothetical protein RhiirA5_382490 [Rhizophagus irregularis]
MVSPPPLEEFIKFNEVALYDFLVDHKSRYAIYFKKMKEQMIDGENFMLLTKQTLEVSPLKFSVEMILLIEDLIKKLKNQEGEFSPYFEILKQQVINGKNFKLLTKRQLEDAPFKFPVGTILLIEDLIEKLKSLEEKPCILNEREQPSCSAWGIETSIEKMNITENLAHSKLNDNGLLRRLFKGIAEAHEFSYKVIADDIRSTNHSISETTVGKFYRGESKLTLGNKLAVQKWVGKFIDEWKKDGQSVTILVKLDTTKSTK